MNCNNEYNGTAPYQVKVHPLLLFHYFPPAQFLIFPFIMFPTFFEMVFPNIKIQQKYTIPAAKISKLKLIHVGNPIVNLLHKTSITVIKIDAKNIERASL